MAEGIRKEKNENPALPLALESGSCVGWRYREGALHAPVFSMRTDDAVISPQEIYSWTDTTGSIDVEEFFPIDGMRETRGYCGTW